MPIAHVFVTVRSAKARNHSNAPRWGSTSWHDLWLSAWPNIRQDRRMRILGLAGRRLAASIPTLILILIGVFLLLQFAPGDTVDAMMAQMGGGDAATAKELRKFYGLDVSIAAQLGNYLWPLVPLDLGFSQIYGNPVASVIRERQPPTSLFVT